MAIAFESDGKVLSNGKLFVRGIVFILALAVVGGLLIARAEGAFRQTVRITAELVDVGDGLPAKSDVKFQGVLVGLVDDVTPSAGGGPNYVHIELYPGYVSGIPGTVTARVVPSNVFAVPSVQLVYNGPARALASGARIAEDRSLATVRLQTSLTALSRIAAAAGRSGSDPTTGILTTIEQATAGRGEEAIQAGAELTRIARVLDDSMAPGEDGPTLDALSQALTGLRASAPDLLGAVHDAVAPLRAVAQQRQQLTALLAGGLNTSGTVATALERNTGTITGITAKLSPPLEVIARGSANFTQMTTSQTALARKFRALWDTKTQNVTAKAIIEFTPHKQYTRADCPRYGNLAGPSCATGPAAGPAIVGPHATAPASYSAPVGGNVGAAGSAQEQQQIATIVGVRPNAAVDLLLGPLFRGNDVEKKPALDTAVPTGGDR